MLLGYPLQLTAHEYWMSKMADWSIGELPGERIPADTISTIKTRYFPLVMILTLYNRYYMD